MSTQASPRKSAVLAAQFRERIQLGEWAPGARLPSFSELRRDLGIAPATVERIYSTLENEGFVIRRQGAGTFVAFPHENRNVISERVARTGYIGFAAPGLRAATASSSSPDPIWSNLLGCVQSQVAALGKHLILLSPDTLHGWDEVEGLVLAEPAPQEALCRRPAHLPCVALQYPIRSLSTIMMDEFEGGLLAVRHLLELGHRNIGFLYFGWPGWSQDIIGRRLSGYQSGLREAGISLAPEFERSVDSPPIAIPELGTNNHLRGGYVEMRDWLKSGWREIGCTALIAQNDDMAIGAMRALREAKVDVPGDVSVMGFDGTQTGEGCVPRLTSIREPLEEIAALGIDLLARQIAGDSQKPHHIILPPALIVRDSTASPKPAQK